MTYLLPSQRVEVEWTAVICSLVCTLHVQLNSHMELSSRHTEKYNFYLPQTLSMETSYLHSSLAKM